MGHEHPSAPFHRPLAAGREQLLQAKPAGGSQYHEPPRLWRRRDALLGQEGLTTAE
jgi:hypothetical protein